MHRTLLRIALSLVAAVAVSAAIAQKKADFFVQISDPQLGFINLTEDFSPEMELMKRISAEVNRLQPSCVVFSGDLVNWHDKQSSWDSFEKVRAMFDEKIPVYYVPGNHDVGGEAKPEDVDAFVKRFGSDRFVHKAKNYTLIGYNSCNIKANNAAASAEYAWLAYHLSRARKNKPLIVVSHHPFFLSSADEPEQYFNIEPETRDKYLRLFEFYGVDLVLTGHLHKCASGKHGQIEFVTAGPAGKTLGSDPSGIEIVKVQDGKLYPTYYPIEKIPQSVE